ncbi:MAG: APC family permease [Vulcanisaeta sp. AZ3]
MDNSAERRPVLFLREATGLVREISPWSSVSAVFGLITGGVPLLIASWFFLAPSINGIASWTLGYIITLIPILGLTFLFYVAGITMPRSGGDYVFNSRASHPVIGLMNYAALWIAFAISLGFYSTLGAAWLGNLLTGLGLYYHNPSLMGIGNWIMGIDGELIVGAILIIYAIALSIHPRVQWSFMKWSGVVTLIATVITFVGFAMVSKSIFYANLAKISGVSDLVSIVVNDAVKAGMSFKPWTYAAMLSIAPIWYYFSWQNMPVSWAGEMRQVRKNMFYSTIIAVLIIAAYYIIYTDLLLHAFGNEFLTAYTYLYNNNISDPVANALSSIGPFPPFFLLLATGSMALYFISWFAFWWPNTYSNVPLVTALVRYLFAWAFDRVAPARLGDVSERFHTPTWALVVVGIVGFIGMVMYVTITVLTTVDVTTVFEISYAVFALVAALMPFVRRSVYERYVPIRIRILGIPLISWIGFAVFAFLVWALLITWGNPILLPINTPTIISLVIMYSIGIIMYLIARFINARKGINLDALFQEIPPE